MDKSASMSPAQDSDLFPETETRHIAERFAPKTGAILNRPIKAEAMRAVEEALHPEPARPRLPVLAVREHTHGNFDNTARYAQRLKGAMRDTINWSALTDVQAEALESIAVKIARILSGDPSTKDHWVDIAGYARLAEERL